MLEHYTRFTHEKIGKHVSKKRKKNAANYLCGWNKKLKIRHNLDVMYTEKNISNNILCTLMNNKGKIKDTIKARMDLMQIRVRSELHPIVDGDKLRVSIACYSLSSIVKAVICDMFAKLKSPDGYLSNIYHCVCEMCDLRSA